MSARKYFAIAEIKANKGQQFALYETLAKEKISLEQEQKIGEFIAQREKLSNTITQIEDLKKLDQVTNSFKSDATADREFLLSEINKIKEKYNIKSWPATEPVLELDLTKLDKEASIEERRLAAIGQILNKLMSDGYKNERESILKELGVSSKKNEIQKNILRNYQDYTISLRARAFDKTLKLVCNYKQYFELGRFKTSTHPLMKYHGSQALKTEKEPASEGSTTKKYQKWKEESSKLPTF
ncbi:hypothetical protein QCA50_021004 [Cerrena zonata]|uniref:Uncharacterized protein n=1 Tax=Cerrena zonata TaxID=2478898 RepID=A0AAW0F6Y8_9APHY